MRHFQEAQEVLEVQEIIPQKKIVFLIPIAE